MENKLITEVQSGFRDKHSTIDQVVRLQNYIINAFRESKKICAIFVDIETAFDMVWRQSLLTTLDNNGIKGNMFNFINNFKHNRSISVKVNGQFSTRTGIINGIPQGCVISPTLFNVSINSITKALNKTNKKK